jgi:hypothetical protein
MIFEGRQVHRLVTWHANAPHDRALGGLGQLATGRKWVSAVADHSPFVAGSVDDGLRFVVCQTTTAPLTQDLV